MELSPNADARQQLQILVHKRNEGVADCAGRIERAWSLRRLDKLNAAPHCHFTRFARNYKAWVKWRQTPTSAQRRRWKGQGVAQLRKSDGAGLASAAMAIAQSIPAEAVTASPTFQAALTALPSSLVWTLAGFSFAMWLIDPWEELPRWKQFWSWLNGEFRVEGLVCTTRIAEGKEFAVVVASIRTGRRIRSADLALRVHSCVGRTVPEEVLVIENLANQPVGSRIRVTLAHYLMPSDDGVATSGLWGEIGSGGPHFLRGSDNLALLELPGRLTVQRHAFFIAARSPSGNDYHPVLFAVEEAQAIFDEP